MVQIPSQELNREGILLSYLYEKVVNRVQYMTVCMYVSKI